MRKLLLAILALVMLPVAILAVSPHHITGDDRKDLKRHGWEENAASFSRHRLYGNVHTLRAENDKGTVLYTFNPQGDVTHIAYYNPDGLVHTEIFREYTYYPNGNIASVLERNGACVWLREFSIAGECTYNRYRIDAVGRDSEVRTECDEQGNPIMKYVYENDELCSFYNHRNVYDSEGRLIEVWTYEQGNSDLGDFWVMSSIDCMQYDQNNRLVERRYVTRKYDYIETFAFNDEGNLTMLDRTYTDSGSYRNTMVYDSEGRVVRLTYADPEGVNYVDEYSYTPNGSDFSVKRYDRHGNQTVQTLYVLDEVGNVVLIDANIYSITDDGVDVERQYTTFYIEYY